MDNAQIEELQAWLAHLPAPPPDSIVTVCRAVESHQIELQGTMRVLQSEDAAPNTYRALLSTLIGFGLAVAERGAKR